MNANIRKFLSLAFIVAAVGFLASRGGIATTSTQVVTICTFFSVICTTLFFWNHRVAAAFLGVTVLVATGATTFHGIIESTELDIILFLVGMMIIVGALKDLGFLTWVIQSIIGRKNMNGVSFTIILGMLAALFSSVVDEVSSIVVVLALVFQVCETLKVRAHPFVLIAVLCTNIGSASTMLGNPVGIFIGSKAGFTFNQFLVGAAPVALVSLVATLVAVIFWFRKDIAEMSRKMAEHRDSQRSLGPTEKVPYKAGLVVLVATVVLIAFHHQIEATLGLAGREGNHNAFLYLTPLIMAGVLMIAKPDRAKHYVEHDVEWWTLLFFMLLFAISGALGTVKDPASGLSITDNLARTLTSQVKGSANEMVPMVVALSSVGSAFVDNIVFVAAFTPVIQSLNQLGDYSVLWWALLFGACFGGNITAVGSTANIVALGLLEKHGYEHVKFVDWLKIGALVGLISGLIAWGMLMVMRVPVPETQPPAAIIAEIAD